jgi:hypothetical protein
LSISAEEYDRAKHELAEILQQDAFDTWLAAAQARGWTRKDVWRLTFELDSEELIDIATALTGDCHPSCMIRFPGDPVDEAAFVKHVRGRSWR